MKVCMLKEELKCMVEYSIKTIGRHTIGYGNGISTEYCSLARTFRLWYPSVRTSFDWGEGSGAVEEDGERRE